MPKMRRLSGYELRCVLTIHLQQNGPTTVADLIDVLDFHGFEVAGRPSKTVSDALRCEMAHERVRRLRHGKYGPAPMPRATEYRIHQRAMSLRQEAAKLWAESRPDAYWDMLFNADLPDP